MENKSQEGIEHISDLADDWLHGVEFACALDAVLVDSAAMQTWHAYHVVGDVLRSDGNTPLFCGLDFLERLDRRLEHETMDPPLGVPQFQSANAQVFRWKLLAGVASIGLAGVLGWGAWSQSTQNTGQFLEAKAELSVVPLAASRNADSSIMLRDPVLDSLMQEHLRLGGHSALHIPAGFLRNAAYVESAP